MTTTHDPTYAKAPSWLNIGALTIPAEAVEEIRAVTREMIALIPTLNGLVERASSAIADVELAAGADLMPDDVAEAVRQYTGEGELYDVLAVVGTLAGEIVESSGNEAWCAGVASRYGFDDVTLGMLARHARRDENRDRWVARNLARKANQ